ncbi:MAG: HAMP domain-containing sensor histidine kinase [Deltaproteobacteria bacterium]|nr:HAMP domain-containing sensor histidine kinase [Deltaproteobacteria bacterium]
MAIRRVNVNSFSLRVMLNLPMGGYSLEYGIGYQCVPRNKDEEVVELYRYVAEEKNIVISTAFSEDLQVTVDPHRIRQVLANLLDNAVKYTPDWGRVDVETTQSPKQIIIAVKDTGAGIPEEEIPKIWNRLYRGDKSRSQRGLGLGLSLVMSIVKAHGGYVEVSSQPGTGSTFTVCLPQGS